MSPDIPGSGPLPGPVRSTLEEFEEAMDVRLELHLRLDGERRRLYPVDEAPPPAPGPVVVRTLEPREGPPLELEIRGGAPDSVERLADALEHTLERTFDFAQEIRFFTYELAERYEEINLLYSISETLGSILRLDDAARVILGEVAEVLGARRGSLWVYDAGSELLHLRASVGDEGRTGPLERGDDEAVTARVFREGRPVVTGPEDQPPPEIRAAPDDSVLSVPIRYSPPAGEARTVGVINLFGRRRDGRFTASDQKLLSAIASQVGAALENHRLIRESLRQERMSREMELAHNLQMKLLPSTDRFDGVQVAARVEPAEQVGATSISSSSSPRAGSGS